MTGRHCVIGSAGVKVLDPEQYSDAASGARVAEKELKDTLEGLAEHLFGQGIEASLLIMPLTCLLECKHHTACGSCACCAHDSHEFLFQAERTLPCAD